MPNLKKNFLYSSVLTTANYIFPLLTYPYVTRILGVSNIGICTFVDSIINYFILISMMGIAVVGVRIVAENKSNQIHLNRAYSSLLVINGIFTGISLIALIICILFVPDMYPYRELLWFGTFKLIFNYLLIDWLYRGLEEFKYITSRSIIVRSIYVISVFIFVRNKNDYSIYYLLSVCMIIVNAIINCHYAKRFVSLSFRNISFKYVKPFIVLGLYIILNSMYTTFNVVYLGFTSGDTQVGYYTTATKLYAIILSLFSAFTTVMLPRISSLLADGNISQFRFLINKSLSIFISFSVPAMFFSIIFANEIVSVVAGHGYDGAVLPMRIVMPLILIIGLEQILVVQILMPMKKDRAIFINSIIGATFGILLNIALVGKYQSIGSSLVWLNCEIVILILSYFAVRGIVEFNFPFYELIKSLLSYAPLMGILFACHYYLSLNAILILVIGFIMAIIYIIICQYTIFKGSFTQIIISNMFKRLINGSLKP